MTNILSILNLLASDEEIVYQDPLNVTILLLKTYFCIAQFRHAFILCCILFPRLGTTTANTHHSLYESRPRLLHSFDVAVHVQLAVLLVKFQV